MNIQIAAEITGMITGIIGSLTTAAVTIIHALQSRKGSNTSASN